VSVCVYIYIYSIEVGIYLLFCIYRAASHRKALSYSSLITAFSATLIDLKTLPNDEGRQHTV